MTVPYNFSDSKDVDSVNIDGQMGIFAGQTNSSVFFNLADATPPNMSVYFQGNEFNMLMKFTGGWMPIGSSMSNTINITDSLHIPPNKSHLIVNHLDLEGFIDVEGILEIT